MVWLEKDLAAATAMRAAGKIDWIITHVHYPNVPTGYCSSKMGYCCAKGNVGMRTELEDFAAGYTPLPVDNNGTTGTCVTSFMTEVNKYAEDLFVKAGVDVHITAHQHVYERTTPVYRYTAYGNGSEPFPANNSGDVFVAPKYPINVNNGCPGNVELQDVWMPRPPWSVGGRYNADGSAGTTPDGYTHFGVLRFTTAPAEKSLRVEYVNSANSSVLDRFTIYRK